MDPIVMGLLSGAARLAINEFSDYVEGKVTAEQAMERYKARFQAQADDLARAMARRRGDE